MSAAKYDAAIEWAPPAWFELDEGTSRRARCTSSEPLSSLKAPSLLPSSASLKSPTRQWSSEAGKRKSRSNPLLFPLSNPLPSWSCMQEQMKITRSGPVSPETGTDGRESQKSWISDGSESLLARLQQAEQSLAEKDQRIEALEACTKQLAERLALAEGLARPKDCKDPSTPTSTRSTSDSTAWSGDQPVLPRNFTMDSLESDDSFAIYAPQTSSVAAKSPRKPTKPSNVVKGTKVSDEYATQADVDAVCRRCEQLLKSVTSAVENNERLASKRKQQKSSVPTLRRLKGSKQSTASW